MFLGRFYCGFSRIYFDLVGTGTAAILENGNNCQIHFYFYDEFEEIMIYSLTFPLNLGVRTNWFCIIVSWDSKRHTVFEVFM
jgi:hypothetical protein